MISPARCGPQPNQTHERNTQMVTPAHACPPGQAPSPSTNWIQCSVCSRHFRASSSARLVGVAARAFPRSRTSSPGRHHWPPAAHHPLCARMIVFMSLQGPSGPGPPRAHARRPHATQTTGPARASHPLSPASVRPAGRRCGASLPTLHASCSAPGSVRVVCFYVLSSRTMDGWMDGSREHLGLGRSGPAPTPLRIRSQQWMPHLCVSSATTVKRRGKGKPKQKRCHRNEGWRPTCRP